ncbi:MAG TPA: (d)CMP kinase [Gemmataceae bacterium]|nr:(d)CMP kinase [Gemmataceae bacterium]
MIVTIDGPAGAGKSSAARALAQRLGFEFLDTGAMYRAVALAALRAGLNLRDDAALGRLVGTLRIKLPPGRVLLDGEDVTAAIRTPEVTAATSPVADSKPVRQHLVGLQRAIAAGRDMVCEGRDQGTIVFPDAARKFFLKADPVERAIRRLGEMEARGESADLGSVLRAQEERDRRDAARDLAPMVPAADAILLDSTHLPLARVVDLMEGEVRRCLNR